MPTISSGWGSPSSSSTQPPRTMKRTPNRAMLAATSDRYGSYAAGSVTRTSAIKQAGTGFLRALAQTGLFYITGAAICSLTLLFVLFNRCAGGRWMMCQRARLLARTFPIWRSSYRNMFNCRALGLFSLIC
jgi:hypothetical protein